jgi:hypothetical protein
MDQIFTGANDLIVDTSCMTELSDDKNENILDEPAIRRVWDYKTSSLVHHNNYFRQKETIDFFRDVLLNRP